LPGKSPQTIRGSVTFQGLEQASLLRGIAELHWPAGSSLRLSTPTIFGTGTSFSSNRTP